MSRRPGRCGKDAVQPSCGSGWRWQNEGKGDKAMKFKLTSLEKKWVLYDVGNSAFTMMVSTIFPIYFNYLAGNAGISDVDYLAYWGYATSVCTLLVAVLGPDARSDCGYEKF